MPLSFQRQPLILPIGVMLFLLWIASIFHVTSLWIFVIGFFLLYEADRIYIQRMRREIRNEERRTAYQRRPLSDFESAQWLNQAVEKIWPLLIEKFLSQEILTALIPWYLDKYKPWTVRKAVLRHLYLGRIPPLFTAIRTLDRTADDDHLVLDLGLDFLAGEDMDAVLAVQMRRRVGLGIWTNIHISRLQIEGKVRVGIKFSSEWPFLSRLRLCFENAPYVQMTAKPVSNHGLNVSDLPGVAGWMERMVAEAFEQSLVEPNMLVLDVERLVESLTTPKSSFSSKGEWFGVQEKAPIAVVHLEILEAADLKPSDLNGLADPFIKGAFATYQFKTKIHKKTLQPKWQEEFKVPVASWELPTSLVLHVLDKDQFRDDDLGYCELDITKYRGGQRHDLWIPLLDIKMGRLHVAIKVVESDMGWEVPASASRIFPSSDDIDASVPDEKSPVLDKYEAIKIGKGEDGAVSVMRPGQPVAQVWQRRGRIHKPYGDAGEREVLEAINQETLGSSNSEEAGEETPRFKPRKKNMWHWRKSKMTSPSNTRVQNSNESCNEILSVGNKGTMVRMKLEEPNVTEGAHELHQHDEQNNGPDTVPATGHEANRLPESPTTKVHMKDKAKNFMKQAGKTAHNVGKTLTRKESDREKLSEPQTLEPVTCIGEDHELARGEESHQQINTPGIVPGSDRDTNLDPGAQQEKCM